MQTRTINRAGQNGSRKGVRAQVPKTPKAEPKPEPWKPEAHKATTEDDGYVRVGLGSGIAEGRFPRLSVLTYICKVVSEIEETVYKKQACRGHEYWAVRLTELYCVAKTLANTPELKFPMKLDLPGFAGEVKVGERFLLLRLTFALWLRSERFLAMAKTLGRERQLKIVDALALAEAVCDVEDRKLARLAQRLRADVMLGRVSRPLTLEG